MLLRTTSTVPITSSLAFSSRSCPSRLVVAMASEKVPSNAPLSSLSNAPDWNEYHNRWERMWVETDSPAFDMHFANRAFVKALEAGGAAQGKRGFVPGCGRGYDVIEMVKQGATTAVGLEISHTAVMAAEEYRDSPDSAIDSTVAAKAIFVQGDFFAGPSSSSSSSLSSTFDLGYDYTFFCAIHPNMRKAWGESWARWIHPGGTLYTLMFPCAQGPEAPPGEGPPFQVRPEDYHAALESAGFKLETLEDVPPHLSVEKRAGREKIARWTRQSD